MDQNHVVLDISSDEDVGLDWAETYGCDSEVDWTELFLNLEKDHSDSHDSDDVILVKEVFPTPKRTKNSMDVANLAAQHREEDDDDCVILDGDPDKPLMEDKNTGYDSDDLVVVAEKGPVACRDYPHPRHLCAQLPFGSTLHSEHCNMCHCYVCDSHAPCGNWGNGKLVTDHCHATEKEEFWKSERKRIKERGNPPSINLLEKPFSYDDIFLPTPAPVPACVRLGQKSFSLSGTGVYQQPIQKAKVSSLGSHAVTSSPILKRPRLLEDADNLMGLRHGDVKLLRPHKNTSEMNTSRRIPSGPTAFQGRVTRTQLHGQRTDQAIGNLNENLSSPGTSNPQCNTSHQDQSFAGASNLEGRGQLPLMEEQSWNSGSSLFPNWEGPDCQVPNGLSAIDTDRLWSHF